jgi:hypothetical protein
MLDSSMTTKRPSDALGLRWRASSVTGQSVLLSLVDALWYHM